MEIVPVSKKAKREIYAVAFASLLDYMDNDVRRIFPKGDAHSYENLIFEDTVALCLTNATIKISSKIVNLTKGYTLEECARGMTGHILYSCSCLMFTAH